MEILPSSPSTMRDQPVLTASMMTTSDTSRSGVFVVYEFVEGGRLKPVLAHLDALRPEKAHVDEDRGRAGTSVVGEGNGARARETPSFV